MKKYLCLILLVAALIIIPVNKPVAASADYNTNNCCSAPCLKVSATEKNKVLPDCVYVNISVETKDTNLETAQNNNAERFDDLLESLVNNNIADTDMKTIGFVVYPEYDYTFGQQKFVGYKVLNQLRIKIKDLESLGKIIDDATTNGATTIGGIEFSLEDSSSAYKEALIKAVNSAKEKALTVSSAVGASDIKITSVNEIMNGIYNSYEFVRAYDSVAAKTNIKQGHLEISATVELKYELVY